MDLDSFITRNNGRVISVRQQLITEAVAAGADRGAANAAYRATGGPVFGAGTGTSDSIPAWLSNGEHVLTAREVLAAGGHGNIMAWRRELLAARRLPAFASGGAVSSHAPVRYADKYISASTAAPFDYDRLASMVGSTFNIQAPTDPVGVAMAVARRREMGVV